MTYNRPLLRTQPLNVGPKVYQPSYQGAPSTNISAWVMLDWFSSAIAVVTQWKQRLPWSNANSQQHQTIFGYNFLSDTHTQVPSQNAWLKLNSIETDLMYHSDQITFYNLAKRANQTSSPVNDAHWFHNSHKSLHMFGYESVKKLYGADRWGWRGVPCWSCSIAGLAYKAKNLGEVITMIALQPVFSNETCICCIVGLGCLVKCLVSWLFSCCVCCQVECVLLFMWNNVCLWDERCILEADSDKVKSNQYKSILYITQNSQSALTDELTHTCASTANNRAAALNQFFPAGEAFQEQCFLWERGASADADSDLFNFKIFYMHKNRYIKHLRKCLINRYPLTE